MRAKMDAKKDGVFFFMSYFFFNGQNKKTLRTPSEGMDWLVQDATAVFADIDAEGNGGHDTMTAPFLSP